ncbi:hypothetical protein scyTo_0027870, partial [Scyliorhinus torazame]|nr:hypothetical protein [Scyliorhinus torazame]
GAGGYTYDGEDHGSQRAIDDLQYAIVEEDAEETKHEENDGGDQEEAIAEGEVEPGLWRRGERERERESER